MTYILVKTVTVPLLLQLQFWILLYVLSIPRWFQSTCCKIIHWDVTTGADTWRDEAVNRYQQQQQRLLTYYESKERWRVVVVDIVFLYIL